MSNLPGSPIVSIYDLLLERKILLAGKGASFGKQRTGPESQTIAETLTKAKAISRSINEYLSCSSEGEALPTAGPSKVTATHLTKKQTGVIMQQPTPKEIIVRLPKKIAPRILSGKSNSLTSLTKSYFEASTSKPVTSKRLKKKKKKVSVSGATTPKAHSADQRMPMSPRKAGGEIPTRVKTSTIPKPNSPKTSQTKLRVKGRKSTVSISTGKTPTTPSSVNRWRI
ncbi:uncharacterized protein LOC117582482 [Drosophila guanche]|uniref:Uncharacterized protein n=1 Tax=Drosophila guanche TaxID=7266 RepID=A0A3B0K0X2_DROGU|nr:uncharacterized protein LOC117582482 [Drosophila guanche]SPP79246.1 Hypothetical predicted protein [Drosophila guanche]